MWPDWVDRNIYGSFSFGPVYVPEITPGGVALADMILSDGRLESSVRRDGTSTRPPIVAYWERDNGELERLS